VRLLYYWLNQRVVMSHQPEPFALAEFEIHRMVAEASGNPFLRASSAVLEFGVAVNILARLSPDRQAPEGGLAGLLAHRYDSLVQAIERGDASLAATAMASLTG
jgi:DNA-binding FadR family transcriptional regulator